MLNRRAAMQQSRNETLTAENAKNTDMIAKCAKYKIVGKIIDFSRCTVMPQR